MRRTVPLTRQGRRPSGRGALHVGRGFTLVELLVVIAVIGLLSAFTVIAVGRISDGARVATAQNAVVVSLNNARALAIKGNRSVLAVFRVRWDPDRPAERQTTEIVLTQWTGGSLLVDFSSDRVRDIFRPIPDAPIRTLPVGVKVAGPWYDLDESDDVWVTQPELRRTDPGSGGDAEVPGRMIGVMFAPDGSVVTANPSSTGDVAWVDWNDDGRQEKGASGNALRAWWEYDELIDEPNVEPVPFLAVFDDDLAREVFEAEAWVDSVEGLEQLQADLTGPEAFISRTSERVHFNRYTGVTMR